jgi:hypothetical protein
MQCAESKVQRAGRKEQRAKGKELYHALCFVSHAQCLSIRRDT